MRTHTIGVIFICIDIRDEIVCAVKYTEFSEARSIKQDTGSLVCQFVDVS